MSAVIREFQKSDEKKVKKCIKELKEYESQFDEDYLTGSEAVDRLFQDLIKAKKERKGKIFVAEANENIAGFISMEVENKNDELITKKVDCIYVSDLVVLPEHRGKNIGKMLLDKANEYAGSNNIKYVKLIVFSESKQTKAIYKHLGFQDYETTMLKKLTTG